MATCFPFSDWLILHSSSLVVPMPAAGQTRGPEDRGWAGPVERGRGGRRDVSEGMSQRDIPSETQRSLCRLSRPLFPGIPHAVHGVHHEVVDQPVVRDRFDVTIREKGDDIALVP